MGLTCLTKSSILFLWWLTMIQSFKPFQSIVASIVCLFLSAPIFASSSDNEDIKHQFDFTQDDLKNRKGFPYKRLNQLFEDSPADTVGARIEMGKKSKLVVTDKDKFKKTFLSMHLGLLSLLKEDEKALSACSRIAPFGDYEVDDLKLLRIGNSYIFNTTSEKAIAEAFTDQELTSLLNETLNAIKIYALSVINPAISSAVRKFIEEDNTPEDEESSSSSSEEVSQNLGHEQPQAEANEDDRHNLGDLGNFDDGHLDRPGNGDEEESDDDLNALRKARDLLGTQKNPSAGDEEDEDKGADQQSDGQEQEYIPQEEHESILQVQKKLVQQQKNKIEWQNTVMSLMPLFLNKLGVDLKEYRTALRDKDAEALKSALSVALSGDEFEEALAEIAEEWNPSDSDQEEDGKGGDEHSE